MSRSFEMFKNVYKVYNSILVAEVKDLSSNKIILIACY